MHVVPHVWREMNDNTVQYESPSISPTQNNTRHERVHHQTQSPPEFDACNCTCPYWATQWRMTGTKNILLRQNDCPRRLSPRVQGVTRGSCEYQVTLDAHVPVFFYGRPTIGVDTQIVLCNWMVESGRLVSWVPLWGQWGTTQEGHNHVSGKHARNDVPQPLLGPFDSY